LEIRYYMNNKTTSNQQNSPLTEPAKTQFNPLIFVHNLNEAAKVWQDILKIIAQEDGLSDLRSGDLPIWHLTNDYANWTQKMLQDPARIMQLGYVWATESANLWQETLSSFFNVATENNVTNHDDKRFASPAWQNNVFYDYIKRQYLMTANWLQDAVKTIDDDLDNHSREKLNFYTKQWIDAIAPSNYMITNPDVLQAALESNGETILRGLQLLRDDFKRGGGRLAISTTDNKAFAVGDNLAVSNGAVIYQNDLMQLIQYAPKTEQVFSRPILLIPAWINKFYIFDMQQKNSLVSWLVAQGYNVFVVSWVNPTEAHRDKSFENYMNEGLLQALNVVLEVSAEQSADCVGYCLGGTLLSCSLAYLHAKGEQSKVASATYLTTMIDFSEPGELGVFIDEEQIQSIEAKMEKKGYLEGAEMATTFSMLRSNNMIWSFVVNNYLLGKEPFSFDLLYWNADSTRMPAAMHSYYLRNMYQQNNLIKAGGIELMGEKIDLTQINTKSFILSAREDHIAPWQSTFAATKIYKGDIEFVLAGSGHIAGVINPPIKNKYNYFTGENPVSLDADSWLKKASENAGSWWSHWHEWLQKNTNNTQIKPLKIGSNPKYPIIEAAPGTYVKSK
jgi:polyhydroxyalkanoate synthase subunit PhaC